MGTQGSQLFSLACKNNDLHRAAIRAHFAPLHKIYIMFISIPPPHHSHTHKLTHSPKLFLRIILYFVFALNVSGDPDVNLLAIAVIVSALLFLRAFGRGGMGLAGQTMALYTYSENSELYNIISHAAPSDVSL